MKNETPLERLRNHVMSDKELLEIQEAFPSWTEAPSFLSFARELIRAGRNGKPLDLGRESDRAYVRAMYRRMLLVGHSGDATELMKSEE